jgi:hypothetical protein
MGYFSFLTTDTGRSISNIHSGRGTFKVILVDNKGNHYPEERYQGYGVFGGQDIFVLIAEMNGHTFNENEDPDVEFRFLRGVGIDLYFSGKDGILMPNIYETLDEVPREWENVPLLGCPAQGFFY